MRSRIYAGCLLLALCAPVILFAEDKPENDPARLKEDIRAAQSEIEAGKARTRELEAQQAATRKELNALKSELVKLAANAQRSERDMTIAEGKLATLERQQADKLKALDAQRAKLSAMTQAAVRLSATPPQAALLLPDDFADALAAARAMSIMSEAIRRDSAVLEEQLSSLQDVQEKVAVKRSQVEKNNAELNAAREKLEAKLKTRAELANKLDAERAQADKRVSDLSRRAETLEQLLKSIEQKRKEEEESLAFWKKRKPKPVDKKPSEPKGRDFASAKGKIRLPAAGKLLKRYGVAGKTPALAKGVLISTRARAEVVAPFDGEVVFTGPFMNYGTLVIVRHSGNFHSLIAGLASVSASVGDFLLEGEPIGAMGGDGKTSLYLELRKDNQPVDPAPWVIGLAKAK